MIHPFRIFCDLVKTASFTKAAALNHITQSAVSHHIRALEETFHQKLLQRRRPIRPTKAGEKVYVAGMEILRNYQELTAALLKRPLEVTGSLKIITTISTGLYEISQRAALFTKQYPKVDINTIYATGPEIHNQILNCQADLGFLPFPRKHFAMDVHILKKDRLVIIAPWKFSTRNSKMNNFSGVFEEPFIALERNLFTRSAIDRLLKTRMILPNIAHTFDNFESIKQAVIRNMGISIVPEGIIFNELKAKLLRKLEIPGRSWEYPLGMVWRKDVEPSAPAQAFIDFILPRKN